ncbi:MAG: protein kinase, partial [Planctomycetota bacterium]
MPCAFRVLSGPYRNKLFPLRTNRKLILGNAFEADFAIPDRRLLPFHCEVRFASGFDGRMARMTTLAEDASIYVDGVPMDEALLTSGERVRVGETTLQFLEGGKKTDPPEGYPAKPGVRCGACKSPIPHDVRGRKLLGQSFCWRCLDLRLVVSRRLGRYVVRRKIGRSIAEITYAAEDWGKKPPTRVSLHVLKSERHKDPRVLRRFLTKTKFAETLNHPLFLKVRDRATAGPTFQYVTDLVEWPTLAEQLLIGRTYPLAQSLYLVCELAQALRFARSKGVIVGRLRPHRLLISKEGHVKFRDYWLTPELEAKIAKEVGAPDADPVKWTPLEEMENEEVQRHPLQEEMSSDLARYLSPPPKDVRFFNNEALDIRPVGTLLFQLVTGTHPTGQTPSAMAQRLVDCHRASKEPDHPTVIPPIVTTALRRCLSKDKTDR